jgi:hypothetical protein
MGRGDGRWHLDGKLEGDDPTLWFDFTKVQEGSRRRHMVRRRGWKQLEVGCVGRYASWACARLSSRERKEVVVG